MWGRWVVQASGRRTVQALLATVLLAVGDPSRAATVQLTDREQAYLATHNPVTLCADPDWWPFEVITAEGRHQGIAADLLEQVSQRTGVRFQLVPTRTWEESVAASKAGRCVAMSFLNQTPDRDQWLVFTGPLLVDPNILITREEHPFIVDLASVRGKTMALPRQTAMYERVSREFPNLKLVGTTSEQEALAWVSERKVDVTLRSMIIAAHTIKDGGWFNLKIAGVVPGYENRLRIGVVKTEPILRDLLDKGVASLTDEERQVIVDRHVPTRVVTAVERDYTLAAYLLGLLLAVILTSLWWLRKLRAVNAQLKAMAETDPLTGVLNRNGLQTTFADDVERAHRYARPLSVILLDIDHFKRINDEMGHPAGDRVLSGLASVVRSSLRNVDSVCRWGGEEFLVVCRETPIEQARLLAERILSTVRSHTFLKDRPLTLSAGVATLLTQDTVEHLVQRADEALYEAKRSGRDRVCVGSPV